MTLQTATRFSVSPRLIAEAPKFFGSLEGMVAEILQNCYRAGATKVGVRIGGANLAFTDDGKGITDPEALVTLGATGWDDASFAPAGMGVFSYLREEVESVWIRSSDWRMAWTQENLTGKEIPIMPADSIVGTEIILVLKKEWRSEVASEIAQILKK